MCKHFMNWEFFPNKDPPVLGQGDGYQSKSLPEEPESVSPPLSEKPPQSLYPPPSEEEDQESLRVERMV